MDTIEKTTTRNYRKFDITNPHRGVWEYRLGEFESTASTYKKAMENIDRMYRSYDIAIATLKEMGAEPFAPSDVAYYRLQRTAYTEAMSKVNTSYGINFSLTHSLASHEEQLTNAQEFLDKQKTYIAEAEKAIEAIQLMGIGIEDKERQHSYAESTWANAKHTADRFAFLAN